MRPVFSVLVLALVPVVWTACEAPESKPASSSGDGQGADTEGEGEGTDGADDSGAPPAGLRPIGLPLGETLFFDGDD